MIHRLLLCTGLILFITVNSHAAKLAASCTLFDEQGAEIKGLNPDLLHEIASVSKVFTTYWALQVMGTNGRYVTRVHVERQGTPGVARVHLQGSRDPYTGLFVFYFLLSELQRLGIREISTLTFDENFKFILDPQSVQTATGRFDLNSPSSQSVLAQLQRALQQLPGSYGKFQKAMQGFPNINVESRLLLQVRNLEYRSSGEFASEVREGEVFDYKSAPLLRLLKEMNRNSNNHAANQIFQALGGATEFHRFMQSNLKLGPQEVFFVNGSGDRLESIDQGRSPYNKATCRSILRVVSALDQQLKNRGLSLDRVLSVAGDGTISNVGRLYSSPEMQKALIGKTGTVDPAITLAGKVSTESGQLYFGYIMKTVGSRNDWRAARQAIKTHLVKLIRENAGGKPLSTTRPRTFLSFDTDSRLEPVNDDPSSMP